MIVQRVIQAEIEKNLFKGKAIIVYGARQVGKTTLVAQIKQKYPEQSLYLNCDEPDIREQLTDKTSTELMAFIGENKLVVIDEAQRIKNIGLTVKLLVDNAKRLQIIATGSSSFDLSNEIVEPLTGRAYEFTLYPLSIEELLTVHNKLEVNRLLERMIVFGMYPEVVIRTNETEKILKTLTRNYLYKDVLEYQHIKNPDFLEKLLQALALQIGSEVSYNELSNLLGIDKKTIASYIRILEQAFIIYTLKPFSRNLRKELGKLRKIYFCDTGIRNALINNFNPLSLRQDTGQLWENFLITERMKYYANHGKSADFYFWRTWSQQELDLVEETGGKLSAFEFKWGEKVPRKPKAWLGAYPESKYTLINRSNFMQFT